MKTLLFLILVFTGVFFSDRVFAQDFLAVAEKANSKNEKNMEILEAAPEVRSYSWEFLSSVKEEFTQKDYQKAGKHELGEEVACLMTVLNERCIKKEQATEGDPTTRIVIRKPVVYNAVRNVEKYCKREMKQNAGEVMPYVLKVAITSLDTDDTQSFEQALQENRKNPKEQIRVFQRVKLNSIY